MQSLIFCVVLALCMHVTVGQDTKYCDPKLCTDWTGTVKPHIACPGNAPIQCLAGSGAKEIVMTSALKTLIVDSHNTKRNDLAGGKIPGLPTARRMPTIQWENELASIALVNAKRCVYGHDECRNTQKYKWSGQNIGSTTRYKDDLTHITSRLDSFWNEYKDCNVTYINKYQKSPKTIGHFTAMAQDKTDRIGCAGYGFNTTEGYKRLLVCNYSYTNIRDQPVYISGVPASGCRTGKHLKYTNLCNTTEVVDPNPTF